MTLRVTVSSRRWLVKAILLLEKLSLNLNSEYTAMSRLCRDSSRVSHSFSSRERVT